MRFQSHSIVEVSDMSSAVLCAALLDPPVYPDALHPIGVEELVGRRQQSLTGGLLRIGLHARSSSTGSSTRTGISRAPALARYSGKCGQNCSATVHAWVFSSPKTSRARNRPFTAPSCNHRSGWAVRLRYHAGSVAAPAYDATAM